MEKDTKYRRYLEGLKKATKKESFLERRMKLASPKAYMKSIGVFPKINKDTLHKTLMSGKNPYSDLVNTTNKGVSKVGEDFVKRRMELAGKGALDYAKKAAKASKYGKIAGAVAAAGLAGSAFLRSKMKDIKEKQQAEGKMGGGMMYKYKSGGLSPKQKKIARMAPPPDKITGDDFKAMKTMKAKSGAMVYVKTKIGKNKPTKIC